MAQSTRTAGQQIGRAGFAYLALLLAFASLSTDLYLPAMSIMTSALGTSHGSLELTVSGYLLGFSVGQLFWGPFSDQRGRKRPLAMGLVLFVIGSIGCGLSTNVIQLIGFRVVQAIGASASVVIARAVIGDLFRREEAAKVLSTLTAVMIIAPMLGPIVGARILAFSNWRTIFFVLVVIGLGSLLALSSTIPESLEESRRVKDRPVLDFAAYRPLLQNKRLVAYAGIGAAFNAGVFAYVAGSPFAFQEYFNVSPDTYGLIFGAGSVGIIIANMMNSRLVGRIPGDRLMIAGLVSAVVAAVGVFLAASVGGGMYFLMAMLFLFVSSGGFVMANSLSAGLASVSGGVGSASALLGFSQYGGGTIGSAVLGALFNHTLYPLALVMLIGAVTSLLVALWLRTRPG